MGEFLSVLGVLESLILIPLVWYLVISHSRHERVLAAENDRIDHWARQSNSWHAEYNGMRRERDELKIRLDEARKASSAISKPSTPKGGPTDPGQTTD